MPMDLSFIQHIQVQLTNPLPGALAHKKMTHEGRQYLPLEAENPRTAGVMILFYPRENQWNIILIERSSDNPHDKHKGQISFPGGQRESEDSSFIHTALRETEEEVGVPSNEIKVLGELSSLYIPVSNFKVFPVVGYVDFIPEFIPQQSEVKALLETPFDIFLQKETRQIKDLALPNKMILPNVPFFNVQGKTVWGATAMILSELLELI